MCNLGFYGYGIKIQRLHPTWNMSVYQVAHATSKILSAPHVLYIYIEQHMITPPCLNT
ncbi:hypothetical protein Mapa_014848 [Marchantia paleacea]|nr:hypothetical protein Mapa_014848 [Marchantia paleacea]